MSTSSSAIPLVVSCAFSDRVNMGLLDFLGLIDFLVVGLAGSSSLSDSELSVGVGGFVDFGGSAAGFTGGSGLPVTIVI
jgi:hypothetical protein